ncbi:MAG TPA: SIR2 family protein [Symbiobacteriaceae bacterium]|jgi:NAD-dependent SIR2 family protein deacetylase|nr:SIR2 family protein [Symbiobacteriaceae bacterium]
MNVYFFGAGASAAEGAPATRDFFAQAWRLLGPAFDDRVVEVWQFLEYVFGAPVAGPASFDLVPAVDEVISLVDWSLHVNQGLGQRYDPPRLYQIRRHLEHLLCATLDAALERRNHRPEGPHARFARQLAAQGRPGDYALLSLNYDTLLDDALRDAGLAPDYGFGERKAGPLLAKLHGSLNWAVCPACGLVAVGARACQRCDNRRLHGLIISPTLIKSYEGAHLQQIWDRALACVQQADRLLFVGYSLPEADVAVYHLIRRGLLAGRRPCPPVTVINHTDSTWSEGERTLHQRSVMARFTRLFGPGVTFDFSGFHGQV